MHASPHFADGVFVNTEPTESGFRPERISKTLHAAAHGEEIRFPTVPLPSSSLTASDLADPEALRVTWMGHSTILIEIDGHRVLTDPIWSDRCSPFSFAGPRRFVPPPVPLESLPPIDAVIISHDHYDHLDEATVKALAARGTQFFVPLGVGAHLDAWGVPPDQIRSFDWWEGARVGALEIVATPARHFSGRSLTDRNHTLWASWVIKGPRHRVYFGGDTGMFQGFLEIGRRYGPFDITLLPIGAYNPRWRPIHMDPEEAVAAHRMLQGRRLVPIHWATFSLAFHDWFEPAERLLVAARQHGVDVATPAIGAPIDARGRTEPWWRPAMAAELRTAPGSSRLTLERALRARGFPTSAAVR